MLNTQLVTHHRLLTESFPNINQSINWVKPDLFSHLGHQSIENGHLCYIGGSVFSNGGYQVTEVNTHFETQSRLNNFPQLIHQVIKRLVESNN